VFPQFGYLPISVVYSKPGVKNVRSATLMTDDYTDIWQTKQFLPNQRKLRDLGWERYNRLSLVGDIAGVVCFKTGFFDGGCFYLKYLHDPLTCHFSSTVFKIKEQESDQKIRTKLLNRVNAA